MKALIAWFVCGAMAASGLAAPQPEEVYARLTSVRESPIVTGVFEGTFTRRVDDTPAVGKDAEQAKIQATRAAEQRVQGGVLWNRDPEKQKFLKDKYGTLDPGILLARPELRLAADEYVRTEVEGFSAFVDWSTAHAKEGTREAWRCVLAPGMLRKESTRDLWVSAANGDAMRQGTETVVHVVRPEWSRSVSSAGSGTIGSSQLPTVLRESSALFGIPLRRAGRANLGSPQWLLRDVISVEEYDTKEDKGLRMRLQNVDDAGVRYGLRLTVLPTKGYMVVDSEFTKDGCVFHSEEFGDYREVFPGLWYPFRQRVWEGEMTLPDALRERVRKGAVGFDAPDVLQARSTLRGKACELTLTKAEINCPVNREEFDLAIPPNLQVYDLASVSPDGLPLVYRNGPDVMDLRIADLVTTRPSTTASVEPTPAPPNETGDGDTQTPNQPTPDLGQRLAPLAQVRNPEARMEALAALDGVHSNDARWLRALLFVSERDSALRGVILKQTRTDSQQGREVVLARIDSLLQVFERDYQRILREEVRAVLGDSGPTSDVVFKPAPLDDESLAAAEQLLFAKARDSDLHSSLNRLAQSESSMARLVQQWVWLFAGSKDVHLSALLQMRRNEDVRDAAYESFLLGLLDHHAEAARRPREELVRQAWADGIVLPPSALSARQTNENTFEIRVRVPSSGDYQISEVRVSTDDVLRGLPSHARLVSVAATGGPGSVDLCLQYSGIAATRDALEKIEIVIAPRISGTTFRVRANMKAAFEAKRYSVDRPQTAMLVLGLACGMSVAIHHNCLEPELFSVSESAARRPASHTHTVTRAQATLFPKSPHPAALITQTEPGATRE